MYSYCYVYVSLLCMFCSKYSVTNIPTHINRNYITFSRVKVKLSYSIPWQHRPMGGEEVKLHSFFFGIKRRRQVRQRLAKGWTVGGSKLGKGNIFRTRTDRPRGPPSLLYNGYRVSLPGIMRPVGGVNTHRPLHLNSHSGPVIWRTLP